MDREFPAILQRDGGLVEAIEFDDGFGLATQTEQVHQPVDLLGLFVGTVCKTQHNQVLARRLGSLLEASRDLQNELIGKIGGHRTAHDQHFEFVAILRPAEVSQNIARIVHHLAARIGMQDPQVGA
jgi:hypothetical protein